MHQVQAKISQHICTVCTVRYQVGTYFEIIPKTTEGFVHIENGQVHLRN
jgi:hypothetical protein